MQNDDCIVFIKTLPHGIHGFTRHNEDGTFSIVLNSRDSYLRRLKAYDHEMKHIIKGDFDKFGIHGIEADAHK